MKRKTKTVWVTRDHSAGDYELWTSRPEWESGYWSNWDGSYIVMCPETIHKHFPSWRMEGGPDSIFEIEVDA